MKEKLRQKDFEVEELKETVRKALSNKLDVSKELETCAAERDKYKDMYENLIRTLATMK